MTATRPQPTLVSGTPAIPKPRHVLFLFDQLRCLDGGAENSLLRIVRLLPPARYRASIVTFWKPSDGTFLKQFPCPIHIFPLDRTYGLDALRTALKLRKIIRSEEVSIVQTFFATSDLWGAPIAKMSGAPVLISSRRDMGFQLNAKHHLAYRLVGRLYDQVHTVSEAVRQYTIREHGMDPDKVIAIPNGVDMERVAQVRDRDYLRAAYGLENASHVITEVGTVKPVKGIDVLVRTAAVVCRTYPRAVFLVVGYIADEEHFKEINRLIESFGLTENFRFVGRTDNVMPFLQMSDVFCHLSRSDGLSNAVLEAMACRLPCVVSRVGGNPEVVEEGSSGFVVPSEQPELAADRVLALLRYPDCARNMGNRGREIIDQNFTAEVMVRRLVTMYDDLLRPHQ
jgi:glycosyltransferase involved in cell wall biosynthesis